MRRFWLIRAVVVVCGVTSLPTGGATAQAGETLSLLPPMDNFALREPPDPPQPGPQFYATTGPGANWNISQWNIPGGKLSPFLARQQENAAIFESQAAEAQLRITRTPSDTELVLNQDGAALPCLDEKGQARESDLFFSPRAIAGGFSLGTGRRDVNSPPLSQLKELVQSATVTVRAGPAATNKSCRINVGRAILSVVLDDFSVHPTQTLFYQLAFNIHCRQGTLPKPVNCSEAPQKPDYYFHHNPFGADDFLSAFGQKMLADGETRAIKVDLLPRLTYLISIAPPGMDKDLSHWVVNGAYFGQHIWGDVVVNAVWRNVMLFAVDR